MRYQVMVSAAKELWDFIVVEADNRAAAETAALSIALSSGLGNESDIIDLRIEGVEVYVDGQWQPSMEADYEEDAP